VHLEIILGVDGEVVERAKDKDAVGLKLEGLNRRQVARKRIEAGRA
jgi:large subunit ribosomal protein L17e